MAQGDFTLFNAFPEAKGDGRIDMDNDVFKMALITNTVVPTAATATPTLSDFTQVSGTNYTAGGETITVTWSASGAVTTADGTDVSWTQNAAGPANIYYGIVYSDTATNDDCVGFVDFTPDGGTTPISLADGDISAAVNASGLFTETIV